jgi:alpha-glucuronidase
MNWTGHTLAQANFYGYGRMAWNPNLSAAEIAAEWVALTFGESAVNKKVENILMKSYPVFAKYNCPFGIGFMVSINGHYGPSIEGYEYSRWGTYHRAGYDAIGIDRTAAGTGFAAQFTPENEKFFTDLATCPENVLLFFHRVRYDYIMHNGQTLLQNIYDTHFEGYDGVLDMMSEWKTLESALSKDVYESVLARFERQLDNAREWRDQINTYFMRRTGIGDAKGRKIYD